MAIIPTAYTVAAGGVVNERESRKEFSVDSRQKKLLVKMEQEDPNRKLGNKYKRSEY